MMHAASRPTPEAEGPTSRFVTVEGVRLHVTDWGGYGPPLLLLHGSQRTGRSWDAMARRLRDTFRVLALDARGHGESDAPPHGYTRWDGVRDIEGVVEGLRLGPHLLAGHSIGGATVALYGARHPDRVRGLLLIEPVPDGPLHYVQVGVFNPDWTPRREEGRRNGWASLEELRQAFLRNRMTQAWRPEVLEDVLHGETRLFPDGHVEMKWHPNAYQIEEMRNDTFSLLEEAPRLTMLVTVMAAATNGLLSSHLEPLARALPQGQLVAVPGVGHNIYMEAPDLVVGYARRLLAEAAGGTN